MKDNGKGKKANINNEYRNKRNEREDTKGNGNQN